MTKFKVGDKVIVKNDLVTGKYYDGCSFANGMDYLKSKILIIEKAVLNPYNQGRYFAKGIKWVFSDGMLELYEVPKYTLSHDIYSKVEVEELLKEREERTERELIEKIIKLLES